MVVTILPMAWRWQLLLKTKGVHEEIPWLTRAYFVSYAAGQVLPTSVGGDAVRIFETARRHPGHGNTAAASVLLERAIGGAATLMLAAVGFLLAVGHYDVGPYLWIEALFVVGDDHPRLPALLAAGAAAAAAGQAAARPRQGRPARGAGLHGDPLLPRPRGRLADGLRGDARRAGDAGPRDLALRGGRGDRPLSASLLRDGPAPLPRHARSVHRQRARGARVVLRQLPRERSASTPTARLRPAFSSSSSRCCGAAGRAHPRLGGPARHEPGRRVPREADG